MSNEDKRLLFDLYRDGLKLEDDQDRAMEWAIKRFEAFSKAYLKALKEDLRGVYNYSHPTDNGSVKGEI